VVTLNGYKFDQISRTYMKDNKQIKEGIEVDAVVTAAKYSNKNFSCFGSLA